MLDQFERVVGRRTDEDLLQAPGGVTSLRVVVTNKPGFGMQSTLSMGTPRLLLAAVALMALCFSFADMALAQTATAYSKEAMEQALATKHHYDLYGIHFDFDKAVIQPDSNALLDDIATALKSFPEWRLRIAGHTDSTGNAAYNETLSMNRTNAIKQALVDRGIDAARLETLGMGEKQPVAGNDTPEGQALNRRVELVRLDVKPNILVIMGDDVGWFNIGAYHLDRQIRGRAISCIVGRPTLTTPQTCHAGARSVSSEL